VSLTWPGVSSGEINSSFVTCPSNCPVSTAAHPTIDLNHIDAWSAFDLNVTRRIETTNGQKYTLYVTVENLFNAAPPRIPGQLASPGFFAGPARAGFYDPFGQYFHAGVRAEF
jgi:iron complex outermembrane recepter protein